MNVYAYVSILDALMKLGICYLIAIGGLDKLILYAIFLCLIQFVNILIYRGYCVVHFDETHYKPMWDKPILKEVIGYSGWNLFANSALALVTYGSTIMLNMFFTSAVVTAMAISNQVHGASLQFVNSFRTAVNPQVVKKYAMGDFVGSRRLLLSSAKYCFFLMLLIVVPLFLLTNELLQLWLKEVPPYTIAFVQITIVTCLFQVLDTSFYTALYAKGQIRENAMFSPTVLFLMFPVVYVLFKMGGSPLCISWGLFVAYAILALIVKPFLIIRIAGYSWSDILSVFISCVKVAMVSIPIPCLVSAFVLNETNSLVRFMITVAISILSVSISVWFVGLDEDTRVKIVCFVKQRFYK